MLDVLDDVLDDPDHVTSAFVTGVRFDQIWRFSIHDAGAYDPDR